MNCEVYLVSYETMYRNANIAVVSAESKHRARSLLEQHISKFLSERLERPITFDHIGFDIIKIKNSGFDTTEEGVILGPDFS